MIYVARDKRSRDREPHFASLNDTFRVCVYYWTRLDFFKNRIIERERGRAIFKPFSLNDSSVSSSSSSPVGFLNFKRRGRREGYHHR